MDLSLACLGVGRIQSIQEWNPIFIAAFDDRQYKGPAFVCSSYQKHCKHQLNKGNRLLFMYMPICSLEELQDMREKLPEFQASPPFSVNFYDLFPPPFSIQFPTGDAWYPLLCTQNDTSIVIQYDEGSRKRDIGQQCSNAWRSQVQTLLMISSTLLVFLSCPLWRYRPAHEELTHHRPQESAPTSCLIWGDLNQHTELFKTNNGV